MRVPGDLGALERRQLGFIRDGDNVHRLFSALEVENRTPDQARHIQLEVVRAGDVSDNRYQALIEHGGAGLYQPVDLAIAKCRMSVAVPKDFDYAAAVQRGARIRVASKYIKIAREHFATKGMHVDLIKLYGSMELAPLVGLADAIVDLVSTGGTLRANNLVEVEEIMQISSRLIVNQASLKMKRERLQPIIEAFAGAVKP